MPPSLRRSIFRFWCQPSHAVALRSSGDMAISTAAEVKTSCADSTLMRFRIHVASDITWSVWSSRAGYKRRSFCRCSWIADQASKGKLQTCLEMLQSLHFSKDLPHASVQSHGKRSWCRYKCPPKLPQSCQYSCSVSMMSASSWRSYLNLRKYSFVKPLGTSNLVFGVASV